MKGIHSFFFPDPKVNVYEEDLVNELNNLFKNDIKDEVSVDKVDSKDVKKDKHKNYLFLNNRLSCQSLIHYRRDQENGH